MGGYSIINGYRVLRQPYIWRPQVEDDVLEYDDDLTLNWSQSGKTIVMNSSSDKTITVPDGNASHIGGKFTFKNRGTGRLTIQLGSNDYADDSSQGGTIFTDDNEIASLTLKLIDATHWKFEAGNGAWETS